MRVLVYGMVGTNRGGIETFLLKMNQHMSDDTIFDYVIEEESCLHTEAIEKKGGRVYYITNRTKNPMKNLKDNRKLLHYLKGQIDVVYFNLSSLSWIFPVKMAVQMGYRVYVHSHNAEFIAANSSMLHRKVNAYNKRKLSDLQITRLTCSKPAAAFMFNPADKVEMIYNAIQCDNFTFDISTRGKIREELDIKGEKVIGFVGRLNDQKNPLFLPDILENVLSRTADVKMLILGDGPMKQALTEKIGRKGLSERCFVMGNKPNVNEYMQAMDLLILPSLHEGLPYVVVEAQTAGLRCIISDRITSEVDITGNVSFLPLLNNADNWGEAISAELACEHDDRADWGAFMSRTNFNIKLEARRLEKILTEGITR